MADFFQGENTQIPVGTEIIPTADYKSVDPTAVFLDCEGATGLQVAVNVTAATGGGGVTVTITEVDPSGTTLETLLASALLASVAVTVLTVDPRITASANSIAQKEVPSRVKVAFVGSGTRTTLNYQASATLTN